MWYRKTVATCRIGRAKEMDAKKLQQSYWGIYDASEKKVVLIT